MDTSPVRRQPTLDEVAERAGVSRSAASRALNNERNVSRAKREAVERAVRELGYVPNRAARALAARQVGAVVLAVAHGNPALFADPFFAEVIVGISAALEKSELELMVVLADTSGGQARLQRILRSHRADGVMLMALRDGDELNALAEQTDVPVVYGGRPFTGTPRWYLDADNRGGARTAIEHLLRTGRRRIATISGPLDTAVGADRHAGFLDALAVAGLPADLVEAGDFTEDGGAVAMGRLLGARPDLDGVFVASDIMALGAFRALKAHGRRIPDDVAVVGFSDLMIAQYTDPPLTTVHQPVHAFGREMARMLVSVIAGEDPTPLILPTRLVIRGSAPALEL